jgi:hypothetical protein
MRPEDFVLPEDLQFYQLIYHKIDINRLFDIELETKMPLPIAFDGPDTFESEFNFFLNKHIPIPSVEAQIKPQIKAYNDESFKQFQIRQGMTYLATMARMFR